MKKLLIHILEYFWAYLTIIVVIGVIGYFININSSPPEGYAGWSLGEIDKCYSNNNNSLECYHLCREHEWMEWHCLETHIRNAYDVKDEYKYCMIDDSLFAAKDCSFEDPAISEFIDARAEIYEYIPENNTFILRTNTTISVGLR